MTTYYISPSGNDSTGSGTSGAPWATFAKFLSSSASGDTCIVAAGTYTWATATVTNRTVQAASGATVIFDAANTSVAWTINETTLIQDIIFQNATLSVAQTGAIIFGATNTYNLTVRRCTFHDITISNGRGLLNVGANGTALVESCLIYDVDRTAVSYIFDCRGTSGTHTFRNNVIYHDEILSATFDSIIMLFSTTGTYIFQNNIAVFTNSKPFYAGTTTGTLAVEYSCNRNITSVPSGTGNITSDPLFVDAAGGNFNLRPTSPCLNAGTLV